MVRRAVILMGLVVALLAAHEAAAGTIEGSIRQLNGNPILDQDTRTLTVLVIPAQGEGDPVTLRRDGDTRKVFLNDTEIDAATKSRINLEVFPPDPKVPEKITWRVTYTDGFFGTVPTDPNSNRNLAVILRVTVSGRDAPGDVLNVLLTKGQTVLHQAFPELPEICVQTQCCPSKPSGGLFGRWRR